MKCEVWCLLTDLLSSRSRSPPVENHYFVPLTLHPLVQYERELSGRWSPEMRNPFESEMWQNKSLEVFVTQKIGSVTSTCRQVCVIAADCRDHNKPNCKNARTWKYWTVEMFNSVRYCNCQACRHIYDRNRRHIGLFLTGVGMLLQVRANQSEW